MRHRWNEYLIYDFIRITGALPGMLWLRPKILYENERARQPMKGGMLLVANHTGLPDPVYLMVALWKRRHHFVCMDTFFEGRFRAWLFRQFHCIPVNRENVSMDFMRRVTEEDILAGSLVCRDSFLRRTVSRLGDRPCLAK